jgi:hypothetical protein
MMLEVVDQLIARARAVAPGSSQAEIINGLTQDYCRAAAQSGEVGKPDAPRLIGRFGDLVFTELNSHGKD